LAGSHSPLVFVRMLSEISCDWDADLVYHPPGRGSAVYHWSSTEGTLHPYRTVNE
jgi:hypothetical protein